MELFNTLFLQIDTPSVIDNQSDIIQIIWILGGVIVTGLVGAIVYLKTEANKKDKKIEDLTNMVMESDKANLKVLNSLFQIQEKNNSEIKFLLDQLNNQMNPKIQQIHIQLMRLHDKLFSS